MIERRIALSLLGFVAVLYAAILLYIVWELNNDVVRTNFTPTDHTIIERLLEVPVADYVAIEVIDGLPGADFWTCLCVVEIEELDGRWKRRQLPGSFNYWGKRRMFLYADDVFVQADDNYEVFLMRAKLSDTLNLIVITGSWSQLHKLAETDWAD